MAARNSIRVFPGPRTGIFESQTAVTENSERQDRRSTVQIHQVDFTTGKASGLRSHLEKLDRLRLPAKQGREVEGRILSGSPPGLRAKDPQRIKTTLVIEKRCDFMYPLFHIRSILALLRYLKLLLGINYPHQSEIGRDARALGTLGVGFPYLAITPMEDQLTSPWRPATRRGRLALATVFGLACALPATPGLAAEPTDVAELSDVAGAPSFLAFGQRKLFTQM